MRESRIEKLLKSPITYYLLLGIGWTALAGMPFWLILLGL